MSELFLTTFFKSFVVINFFEILELKFYMDDFGVGLHAYWLRMEVIHG